MTEIPTYQGPVTREQGLPQEVKVLSVVSSRDTVPSVGVCGFPSKNPGSNPGDLCGGTTEAALINYEITFQGVGFRVPEVWTAKCNSCEDGVFFAPEVDDQIGAQMSSFVLEKEQDALEDLNPLEHI